jgi:hypothetical protein
MLFSGSSSRPLTKAALYASLSPSESKAIEADWGLEGVVCDLTIESSEVAGSGSAAGWVVVGTVTGYGLYGTRSAHPSRQMFFN